MNKKVTGIVAYIGLIGWVIAFFAGDKEGAKFHLNQGLVLSIISGLVGYIDWIPVIGWIVSWVVGIAVLVFSIMGIVYACQEQDTELPLIGQLHIIN